MPFRDKLKKLTFIFESYFLENEINQFVKVLRVKYLLKENWLNNTCKKSMDNTGTEGTWYVDIFSDMVKAEHLVFFTWLMREFYFWGSVIFLTFIKINFIAFFFLNNPLCVAKSSHDLSEKASLDIASLNSWQLLGTPPFNIGK